MPTCASSWYAECAARGVLRARKCNQAPAEACACWRAISLHVQTPSRTQCPGRAGRAQRRASVPQRARPQRSCASGGLRRAQPKVYGLPTVHRACAPSHCPLSTQRDARRVPAHRSPGAVKSNAGQCKADGAPSFPACVRHRRSFILHDSLGVRACARDHTRYQRADSRRLNRGRCRKSCR